MSRALLLLTVVLLSSCAAKLDPNAAQLGIDYEWTPATRCSVESPEIRLTSVPAQTKKLRVDVFDRTVGYEHGGGTVAYTGTNTIVAGALQNFRGPCPPSGSHEYVMTIDALDGGGVIIARGEKTKSCC